MIEHKKASSQEERFFLPGVSVKKLTIFLFLLSSLSMSSCYLNEIVELLLAPQPRVNTKAGRNEESITAGEASRRSALYWAITVRDVNKVKQYLEDGYDPNKSSGEEGWMVRTPLNIIARSLYDSYPRIIRGEKIPDPPPDVAMLYLLVEAGANVNQRPYIWCRVNMWDDYSLERKWKTNIIRRTGRYPETEEDLAELEKQKIEEPLYFIKDANRVIEAFLKAGADPDKLGHPYPYSVEAKRNRITDEEAEEYFARGTRPINEAIKKGMWWESQVDLLLQYTTLDEASLEAAKESGDPAMLEKIINLWNEQNAREIL